MTALFQTEDMISIYSRAEAIDDGMLIDVTETAKEAGFKFPVALTRGAWFDAVEWSAETEKRKPRFTAQDEEGRLWDVLIMAKHAVGRVTQSEVSAVLFQVLRVPSNGKGIKARLTTLKMHVGPGDQGEGVITVSLPDED